MMLGTALAGSLLFTSCDKDNDDNAVNNTYTVSGNASSSQEVPAVTSSGAGSISGTYNKESNRLDYTIGWTGLTGNATNVGFYTGAPGTTGTAAQSLSITTNGLTGNSTGSLTLSDEQETDLLSGKWYYNVGTLLNPGGEIRGQVSATQNK